MAAVDETLIAEACELFCGRRSRAVMAHVAANVRSPYELPYAFLDPGTPLANGVLPGDAVLPTARHVELAYALLLQRRPESPDVIREHLRHHRSMTSLLRMFLLGREYRARLVAMVAMLTTGVRRVWHVHIPKTAGTSFARAFEDAGWAVVNVIDLADPTYRIADLARTVSLARLRRGVLVTGHQALGTIAPLMLPFDVCLAFLRHPLDRVRSFFNYMTMRLEQDPAYEESDTRDFVARGFDPTSFERTYLGSRILTHNEQCGHLAREATAGAALAAARRAGCRLLDHRDVDTVLGELLNVADPPRHNVSRPVLDRDAIPAALARRILDDNAEDLALYDAVRTGS